ncbi:hypothetical protein L204_101403 [Cryptococcus depauperatus]|nr:hypothetical protein L204_04074 [Cryptococcus depauperatus CBS 7855]
MSDPQILLILAGLPGSGKTTFSEALIRLSPLTALENTSSDNACATKHNLATNKRLWIRASQDEAARKRRQEVEAKVRWGLSMGFNVVVDRMGFDRPQRSHFVAIANEFNPRPLTCCLVFTVTQQTLTRRLLIRKSHPTIQDGEQAIRVLHQTRKVWQPPTVDGEGFDRIHLLQEWQQPDAANGWTVDRLVWVMSQI